MSEHAVFWTFYKQEWTMLFGKSSLCAVAILACTTVGSGAAILKAAGQGSTTTTATTSGQNQIKLKIDPYNVSSFLLNLDYDSQLVQFVSLTPLNGYVIDNYYDNVGEGTVGTIGDIHGYYPGFNDGWGQETFLTGPAAAPTEVANGAPQFPPAGKVDLYEIIFLDLDPTKDKTFTTYAGPFGYLTGVDPETGQFTTATGPQLTSSVTVFGVNPQGGPGGGAAAPLPGALVMGLFGGVAVVGNAVRNRRKA